MSISRQAPDSFLPALSYTHADFALAQKIWADRYALHDPHTGEQIEQTWAETARRVGTAFSLNQEAIAERFTQALQAMELIPGGRIIAGAGLDDKVTYSNCFVLPIEDSRQGIMRTTAQAMEILSKGGGVGFNFTPLRPKGSVLKSSRGHASGPCSFVTAINAFAHTIEQGGSRRAAMMGQLHVDHPDIREWIHWKQQHPPAYELAKRARELGSESLATTLEGQFNAEAWEHLNVSVQISDSFIKRVRTGEAEANTLWDEIAEQAWASGDPGLFFIDRVNQWSPSYYFQPLIGSNPCAEQALPAFGSCNLLSINLKAHLRKGPIGLRFDWEKLRESTKLAVLFLDNVLETNHWPIPEVGIANDQARRLGIGTMGFADTLVELNIPYGTPAAESLAEDIYLVMALAAYQASAELAGYRGSFGVYEEEAYLKGSFVQKVTQQDRGIESLIKKNGMRNVTLLTQAPTGSTSMLAGVSSGIEPHFDRGWTRYDRVSPQGVTIVSEYAFHPAMRVASELSPAQHLGVQAAAQRWIDSALSKTVNMANTATVDDVKDVYNLAIEMGLKGVTVFRDGCRGGVLNPLSEDELLVAMMANCPTGKCDL